jgi:hypothetical protein
MGSVKDYFSSLGTGIASLIKGMQVTGKELVTRKITEEYPDLTAPRLRVSAPSLSSSTMPRATTSV